MSQAEVAPAPTPRIWLITAVLALLSMFPPVATDMYLSSMGELARALDASAEATGLSLSLFFLGLCVGQLVMGPLIDGYGRKAPLLAGVALFTLTSVGLLLTRDVLLFNTLRFFQAIGACAGMVVGRAVVSDLFSGRQAARMMTVLVMLMTLGPILSPFLGSLLATSLGWRSIFYTMVALGLASLLLTRAALPETLPPERRARAPFRTAFARLGLLLRRRAFIVPALVAACIQASMFAFISGSSGTFQTGFGLSAVHYGLLFGVIAAALVIFGQLNAWLLNHFDPRRILATGLPLQALAGAALLVLSGSGTLWLVATPLWLAIGLVGLLSANAMSITMEGSPEGAGIGSALLGGLQFGIAFLVSSAVSLGGGGATAMGLGIFLPAAAACLIWLTARPRGTAT